MEDGTHRQGVDRAGNPVVRGSRTSSQQDDMLPDESRWISSLELPPTPPDSPCLVVHNLVDTRPLGISPSEG